MTKLEKIEEIIREYENGADAAIKASDVLEGIKTVVEAPEKDYDKPILSIETPAGNLCAECFGGDYPSVSLYFTPEGGDGAEIELARAETKIQEDSREKGESEKDVFLYTYADPSIEEYTYKSIIKREDVIKTLGIEQPAQFEGDDAVHSFIRDCVLAGSWPKEILEDVQLYERLCIDFNKEYEKAYDFLTSENSEGKPFENFSLSDKRQCAWEEAAKHVEAEAKSLIKEKKKDHISRND